jgi:hypothetical protein
MLSALPNGKIVTGPDAPIVAVDDGVGDGVRDDVGVDDSDEPGEGVCVGDDVCDGVGVIVGVGGVHATTTAEPAAPIVVDPPTGVFVPPYVAIEVFTNDPPPPPPEPYRLAATAPPPPLP